MWQTKHILYRRNNRGDLTVYLVIQSGRRTECTALKKKKKLKSEILKGEYGEGTLWSRPLPLTFSHMSLKVLKILLGLSFCCLVRGYLMNCTWLQSLQFVNDLQFGGQKVEALLKVNRCLVHNNHQSTNNFCKRYV